jgi:AraC-like DNA-binding protein
MKLQIKSNQMEEVEGLHNAYPYAFHPVDMGKTVVPWHWHEALEFGYVQAGSVKVSTAEQTQEFSKGEGFFINSNVLTAMTDTGGCFIDSHLFHPVFLSGHFKSVYETKYLNPVIQNRNLDLLPIRGQTQPQKQLLQKLRQLSGLQGRANVEFQTRNLLSEIWLLLLEELSQTKIETVPSKNQDRMLTMLSFIQENFAEKLTLTQIAEAGSVSTRECLRCFRASINQSPMEYLLEYRVRAAEKLLEATELSVTEVAMRTGWGSGSYFTKMFRRICGKTPNAYRKERVSLKKQMLDR